jgi:glucose/arabinose dehydrogenase
MQTAGRFGLWAAAMTALIGTGAGDKASAQNIQPGSISIELDLVATTQGGASAPNFGTHSDDPRFLYVGQKTGAIRILDFDQANPLLGTTFLNVDVALSSFRTPTQSFHEYGLLGGAFHPDFDNQGAPGYGKFYTYTSEFIVTPPDFTHTEIGNNGDHQSVIREWTANEPDNNGVVTINTGIDSRVLMRINEPQSNHNGGALAFGHDDYLYISLGDGGGGNDFQSVGGQGINSNDGHTNPNNPDTPGGFAGHGNAQDRRNVFGSVLRIKPTVDADEFTSLSANEQYRIPNDNPFTAESNDEDPITGWQESWVDEIFAYGLRNPFRMSIDRESGRLYVADVGQGTIEEINVVDNGDNLGWVIKEGTGTTSYNYSVPTGTTLTDPIGQYPNGSGGGIAVIGGYVYRGESIPELQGKYVFGDLSRSGVPGGGMMYMDVDEPGLNQVFDFDIVGSLSKPTADLHGLAEDANGEVYYLFSNGQVLKLVPEPFLPGDYDGDGDVDAADYQEWKDAFGTTAALPDGNKNGIVDAADYTVWRDNLGNTLDEGSGGAATGATTVPEPAALVFCLQCLALTLLRAPRRARI